MQILFRAKNEGPFRLQKRATTDASAQWADVLEARITEIESGVYLALAPKGLEDMAFYRIVSENETIAELKGWSTMIHVSAPANGKFFVQGESPMIHVTILDNLLQGLSRADFATLNLYMFGPQDPQLTVSANKLLNAVTDRTKRPHHYIDLKTNPEAEVKDNRVSYKLRPITDEAPGTYTIALYCVLGTDAIQQIMKFVDIQIGTATVETLAVERNKCAACHEGSSSGKMYLHHVDPGRSPVGSFSIDMEPVKSCKVCHNNDGYAAIRDATGAYIVDPIIRRAHGVHMGEHLKSDFNINPTTGDFRHYTHVLFPADARNCSACHVDDRWKTRPTRAACGSCHDNIWFGAKDQVPAGLKAHTGGAAANDSKCAVCHAPDGLAQPIDVVHNAAPPKLNLVDIQLTPPANGKFYVAGEKPLMTLVFHDDAGKPIDHTKITTENFSTANFLVYGPRNQAVPVLTSAAKNGATKARASVSSSKAGPWAIKGKTFKLAVNGNPPENVTISGAADSVTAAEVVASLNAVIEKLGAKATVSGANVNIRTTINGAAGARIEIYNGDVTTAMGWKRAPNTTMDPDVTIPSITYAQNDLRPVTDPLDFSDPNITRSAGSITYQLDDVAGLAPGTYATYAHYVARAGRIAGVTSIAGVGHKLFQIGSETPQKKIATNCADCHGDTLMHATGNNIHASPFDTDYCAACHDYGRSTGATGEMFKNQGGTSLAGWSGYGAMPISRRVHAVHNGHYLEHPEEIYANATKDTFGNIIFPQDIRNCTKCHAESDTWKQKPSRVACMACHDTDEAKAHGRLMTFMLDTSDPYGPLAVETCKICHGAGTELSADKVHNISKPYVPPYPRERAE